MKTSALPQQFAADGSEEIVVVCGPADAKATKRMPAALLAAAGTRPTPDEIKASILATFVPGANITLTQNADGTIGVAVAASPLFTGTPKAPTAAAGTSGTQIASTAFVTNAIGVVNMALATKQGLLVEGAGIDLVDNGDGTVTISSTGGGGTGLVNGVYGDITVSGNGTVLTVNKVTNGAITVPDEAYGNSWATKLSVPTKNALFNQLEAINTAINTRVAASAVGAVNGVAGLDATGKVPASQLPSYVDDVLEFVNAAAFPAAGESGKIYIALDTGFQWRWTGTAYTQIVSSPGTTDAVAEGANNLYYTDVRVRAAVLTGLVDIVGTPAAADSLLTALGKLRKQAFTTIPAGYLALGGGRITGRVDLDSNAGGYIRAWDYTNGVEFGRLIYSANGAYLRGSKINLQNVAGAQLGTVDANGNYIAVGYIDVNTPNAAQNGGVRIRGNATSGFAYQNFTDASAATQWGYLRCDNAGALYWSGALTVQGNITYASDARFKTDIGPLEAGTALQLAGRRYIKDGREQVGFIAQEVEEVLPEAVITDDGPDGFKSLDLAPIVAALVEEVKRLSGEVAQLKAAA